MTWQGECSVTYILPSSVVYRFAVFVRSLVMRGAKLGRRHLPSQMTLEAMFRKAKQQVRHLSGWKLFSMCKSVFDVQISYHFVVKPVCKISLAFHFRPVKWRSECDNSFRGVEFLARACVFEPSRRIKSWLILFVERDDLSDIVRYFGLVLSWRGTPCDTKHGQCAKLKITLNGRFLSAKLAAN